MRKSELRKRLSLTVTAEMKRTAGEDREVELPYYGGTIRRRTHEEYIRADVEKGILAVYFFSATDILADRPDPKLTVYMDRQEQEYATWDGDNGGWRNASLCHMEYFCYPHTNLKNLQGAWIEPKSEKTIRQYFGKPKGEDVIKLIKDFQETVRKKRLEAKHNKEKKKIDEEMEKCPPIPKEAAEWARMYHMQHSLIYDRKKDRAVCTHCRREMTVSDVEEYMNSLEPWQDGFQEDKVFRVKEKGKVFCPLCLSELQAESWGRNRRFFRDTTIEVLRKRYTGGGWVISHVEVNERDTRKENGEWEIGEAESYEWRRTIVSAEGEITGVYRWEHFKGRREVRWCRELETDRYGQRKMATYYHKTGKLYPENLKEAEIGTPLEHMAWRAYEKGIGFPKTAQKCINIPELEYLRKCGMTRLENEIVKDFSWEALKGIMKCGQGTEGLKIWERLGLDRDRFERLKRLDGGLAMARILSTGEKISQKCLEEIRWGTLECHQADTLVQCAEKAGLSIERTHNYVQKQKRTYRQYLDYLNMAEEMELPVTDDIVRFPKDLKEKHDELVERKKAEKERERSEKADRKFRSIIKNRERNEKLLTWKTQEYIIYPARKASDLIREGRALHHCVGSSEDYMKRMDSDRSFICMLRRAEKKRTPYYTIEIDRTGKVLQWYSEFDRKPDREVIEPLIRKYEKTMKKRMEGMKWSS